MDVQCKVVQTAGSIDHAIEIIQIFHINGSQFSKFPFQSNKTYFYKLAVIANKSTVFSVTGNNNEN